MAKQKRKKPKSAKLSIGPLEYQLVSRSDGVPHQEVITRPGDPGLEVIVDADPRAMAIEDRAGALLQMMSIASTNPTEFVTLVTSGPADNPWWASLVDLVDWAEFYQEEIADAVAWWNEQYPQHLVRSVRSMPSVRDWPAIFFLLTGVGAAGTAAAAILEE